MDYEEDMSGRIQKRMTITMLIIILIGIIAFVFNNEFSITGFVINDIKKSNYCSVSQSTISPYSQPDIKCTYLDYIDKKIKLRVTNNLLVHGKDLRIEGFVINTCSVPMDVLIKGLGSYKDIEIPCEDISIRNKFEITYTNMQTGLSHDISGTIGIFKK